jgi:tetratricopeptide (TPR) repeat protein
MTNVPFKGRFSETRLPLVLIYLNRNRLTGTLEIKTPSFTKKVYLEKGEAIFSSSTNEDDRLGEMLLKVGKITLEQFDKAVEILKKGGKRLGAILVELGYLSPKELFWGVKFQVREIIYSIFLVEEAEYEFIEGEVPSDEVIKLKMSMGNLIYEGVKRIDNLTRIRREMPALKDTLMLSDDPLSLFQNIELSSQDKKLLSLVDGQKTIKEILDASWVGSFDAMKILYVLFYTGMLVKKERPVEKRESIMVDDLLKELSEDEMAFDQRVDMFLKKIETADDYELLGVDRNADESVIKRKYFRLAKEFHPDKYLKTEDVNLKDKLTAIFDTLTDAYNNLKVSALVGGQKATTPVRQKLDPKKAKEEAQRSYQQGIEAIKKGQIADAIEYLRKATSLDIKNPQYWNALSLAFTKSPDGISQAEKALLEAINLEPDNADFLANLGLIFIKAGNVRRAKTQFNKALTLDPANKKAKRGLQDLEKN